MIARVLALLMFSAAPAVAGDMDALVKAYPAFLAGQDGRDLIWTDGTRQPLSDGRTKTFAEKLSSASLVDQMSLPYPTGPFQPPKSAEDDPGRFRNIAFFDKMYGDCDKGAVQKHMVAVKWLPKSWGKTVQVTTVNGVADKLKLVSDEIEALPPAIRKFAWPSAGTFNCRVVKDTGVRSAHAYGIAIDLNTTYSDYWLWSGGNTAKGLAYKNRMPLPIVAIFEKYGFIWGGKWGHYDTMHFEYRPELLSGK